MAETRYGSREVEETLRLVRDAVERDIARYRAFTFAVVVVVTGALRLFVTTDTWIPTIFFSGAFCYAMLLHVYLARVGNRGWIAICSLLCDLGLCTAVFHVVSRLGGPVTLAQHATFVSYVVGPALGTTLLINSLRNSVVTSLVGAIAAPLVFLATAVPIAGFHPAQVPVAVVLVVCALIGVASARQARKSLDSFARLQLLRRYLPPAAVERVMRDDPSEALALGGRLVTVTLLAADLRGFTAMSEKLAPSEVMAQLNAYHGAMVDVIEQYGGAIDKFIGDGTLVVFGLTGTPEAAAEAAVGCAAAMLDALDRHNDERVRAGAPPLRMGIGVHTGPVIAGNLGVPGRRLEFTVIGDAVNTASRLEGQTKQSGTPVIVSAETVALLGDATRVRELAPVSIRGKEQPLRIYGLARDAA